MLYGTGSKRIELNQLLESHGDRDFEEVDNTGNDDPPELTANNDENEALFRALAELKSDFDFKKDEDADSVVFTENDKMPDSDTLFPAIPATISNNVTATSLDRFRREGLFGKLHNIGVLFRKSSTLKHQFLAAQREVNPDQEPKAWVHNVATRWSSDNAMAERALELRRALGRLFVNIEEQ
jgi:hypothetical protein